MATIVSPSTRIVTFDSGRAETPSIMRAAWISVSASADAARKVKQHRIMFLGFIDLSAG
jgi:hypothetical protein